MADLNALIAQGAQFRQAPDPFVQYGQMQQLEQNRQTNALNQMKMQEMQRGMETTNALNKFLPGLTESNRSQLLGYGAAGQGVYKTLAEGDTQQRLRDQARSQADLNKSNILKNVVAQTRDAVAGIGPDDAPTYMALRESVLGQYPDLAPHMPAAWDANVKQRLITTATSVLEGQKPRPPVILRPGDMAIPGNDPRLMGAGVTAPAAATAAAKPPEKLEIMRALGYPMDAAGDAAYEAAKRAAPTVSAPPVAISEMRALGIPETPEGFKYYNELKTKTSVAAPPVSIAEYERAKVDPAFMRFLQARAAAIRPPAQPRAEAAPSITTIIDPTDSSKMITVDARRYTGGGVGSPGVIGVGGKEPGAALRVDKAQAGKTQLADDLDNLRASFTRLDELRAIPSTERNVVSNLMSAAGSSGIGQTFGRAGGSPEQVERDVINSARQRLISSIKNATGMSARSLDSNVELKTMLNSISDPSQSFEAAMRIIDDIENAYVKGAGMPKKNAPGGGAPGTPSANVDQQRQDANNAIAKGAPAAAVRQRFKQNTGQEL